MHGSVFCLRPDYKDIWILGLKHIETTAWARPTPHGDRYDFARTSEILLLAKSSEAL